MRIDRSRAPLTLAAGLTVLLTAALAGLDAQFGGGGGTARAIF